MSSTFFDLAMLNRYTWYSNDRNKTRKINDYVLVEKFVQKFVTNCRAEPDFDFDSDHRLLKTTVITPSTRKARRTTKIPPMKAKPDIKALLNPTIQNRYVENINKNISTNMKIQNCPVEISKNVINVVNSAA